MICLISQSNTVRFAQLFYLAVKFALEPLHYKVADVVRLKNLKRYTHYAVFIMMVSRLEPCYTLYHDLYIRSYRPT